MSKIKDIKAREILNGKGEPTVETIVTLTDGKFGVASTPSGTTVGSYEAVDLKDRAERFLGHGVQNAVANVNKIIAPQLVGMEATKQQEIDKKLIELDGTSNKGRLGANSTLSTSIAVAKAASQSSVLPLFLYLRQYLKSENLALKIPTPIFNVLSGSKNEDGADFKNFLVLSATSKTYSESVNTANIIYNSLKNTLKTNNLSTLISDQGGFAPKVSSNEEAFSLIKQSVDSVNLRLGFDVFMGVDVSANEILQQGKYKIKDKAMTLSSQELSNFYEEMAKKFNILYIEDPFSEEDWDAWTEFTTNISSLLMVVSDNLTVTNPYRLQMALDKKAITGIVVKPGQIGTVIEAIAVVEIARQAGLKIITSVRSEETNDDFIADFAVAVSADYLKFGSLSRGEMIAKYNRLFEIEEHLKAF